MRSEVLTIKNIDNNHTIKKGKIMKIKTVATLALIMGLNSVAYAKTHGAVFSPEQGIICDKKSHFCVDSEGISMGYTKEYLGQKAQDKFMKMIEGIKDMDMTSFTLSNGLNCDTKQKICKKSKWDDKADPHWTKILFGK